MSAVSPLLATGIAPHSVGEVFVKSYLKARPNGRIIGIDRISNKVLEKIPGYSGLVFNLNPLSFKSGLKGFEKALRSAVLERLKRLGDSGFQCLIQFAGVYDFGPFLEHDVNRRETILGVNFVGHVEVLHTVMAINKSVGIDNSNEFTYIELGSYQALYARAQRPIYAPSKAAGIDLCTALNEGKEIKRCIYFAPGPIDTHMLHYNHWVTKAKGSPEFFEEMFEGPTQRYRKIFVECHEPTLREAAGSRNPKLAALLDALTKYVSEREKAFKDYPGVLKPGDCAHMLVELFSQPERYVAGIYVPTVTETGTCTLRTTAFHELSRMALFEKVARTL